MAQDRGEPGPPPRRTLAQRLVVGWTVLWSWLTDPAVLVYRRAAHGRKRARILIVEFFLLVREVTREFWMIEGTSRAASLAYTTLLSLIPLLVAFTVPLKRYLASILPDFETTIDNVLNVVIPYHSPQVSYHLARFADNAATASTLGIIVFLVIAFRLFLAVEGTVNQIWKVPGARGYRQKIIAFTMLFFWGPLLMGLSLTTTRSLERSPYLRLVFRYDIAFTVAPIVLLFLAFTMLFWLVPSTRVKFSAAAAGALVTTMLFSLVRWGFGNYADQLAAGRFNIIYGTVALAIIFLIAIELMWIVILLGVEISYVYQNLYGVLRASEQQIDDEPRFDLYFALRAMIEVVRRFERREEAPSSYRLAEQFGTTDAQMLRVLRRLEEGKLVQATGSEWTGFVPGGDPDRIGVEEVVAQVEGSQRALPALGPDDEERRVVGSLFATLNACTANALDRMTVGRLVRELYSPRAVRGEAGARATPPA
ncbi:MAG TPA: YhjD/YihY/BrkB family envelope integrity protein [Thermoanaerobaculia bacterium]|nr:YhjD/YihY/BrkB family envelope integrity protein [Thermoanaerobaculia bacterium]